MGSFKTVLDTITIWLINHDGINEVTNGDINEVDLSTNTNFPLVHIIYTTTNYSQGYNIYNYQILFLDTYFEDKDNKIEILDNMNEIVTQFVKSLTNGSLFNSQVRVDTTPSSQVMYDQLQNRLYGWSLNVGIMVPNGIIICV